MIASSPSTLARNIRAMALLEKIFLDHPRSVGESYFRHMACAARYGFRITLAGLACMVHSLAPALFPQTASSLVRELAAELEARRRREDCADLRAPERP